jgi:hypothetical protein
MGLTDHLDLHHLDPILKSDHFCNLPVNTHTQYTAIFARELASYVAVEEAIRESEAAAAVMNLVENIMIRI